jgi:hypothetical protein
VDTGAGVTSICIVATLIVFACIINFPSINNQFP